MTARPPCATCGPSRNEGGNPIATPRQTAIACAAVCEDKKASDIAVLDVRRLTSVADYFVLCSTTNERQSRAIAEELRALMRRDGRRELGIEGVRDGRWILQDFGDVVVHVFLESQREYYDLDGLWSEARRVRWGKSRPKA